MHTHTQWLYRFEGDVHFCFESTHTCTHTHTPTHTPTHTHTHPHTNTHTHTRCLPASRSWRVSCHSTNARSSWRLLSWPSCQKRCLNQSAGRWYTIDIVDKRCMAQSIMKMHACWHEVEQNWNGNSNGMGMGMGMGRDGIQWVEVNQAGME